MDAAVPSIGFISTLDWMVDDPWSAATTFARVFSLPEVRPSWRQSLATHGYEAVFARAHDDVTAAPTRLEFITATDTTGLTLCEMSPYEPVTALQRGRDQLIHATVLAIENTEQTIRWITENNIAARIEEPCEHLPLFRIWFGWNGEEHVAGVEPDTFLEMIPAEKISPRVAASIHTPNTEPGRSRLGWRMFLVDDLDTAVDQMLATTALRPSTITHDEALGVTRARYTFSHPGSAALDLAVPDGTGPAHDYFGRYGPGVFVTALYVTNPEKTIEDTVEQGAKPAFPGSSVDHVLAHHDLPGMLIAIEAMRQSR